MFSLLLKDLISDFIFVIAPGTAFASIRDLLFLLDTGVFYCKIFAVYDITKMFCVRLKCLYDL